MVLLRWIGCYALAIVGGSIFMLLMHHLSGLVFPEAAMAKMPQDDPEALRIFMLSLGLGPKVAVLLSHWLGTGFGAFLAMQFAPVRSEWLRSVSMIKATIPGWAMGIWFTIGGAANAAMIPMPMWMLVADLVGYLPVAFFVSKLIALRRRRRAVLS